MDKLCHGSPSLQCSRAWEAEEARDLWVECTAVMGRQRERGRKIELGSEYNFQHLPCIGTCLLTGLLPGSAELIAVASHLRYWGVWLRQNTHLFFLLICSEMSACQESACMGLLQ